MNAERLPFASGQPLTPHERDPRLAPPGVDRRGWELLQLIRDLAADEADALSERCSDRRINHELLAAEPLAIAQRLTYLAIAHLAETILADRPLTASLAAVLGRAFPK